jgi:TonB family protein
MRSKSPRRARNLLLPLILLASVPASADLKEMNEAYSAMNAGFAFSDDQAANLETGAANFGVNGVSAGGVATHIALLAYYSVACKSLPVDVIKQRRAEHIFWIIRRAPKSELFNYATAIDRIFLSGDRLADPDRFRQAAALWMKQIESHPQDRTIQQSASRFLELGDPAAAAALLRGLGGSRSLGSLYGLALLGVVAKDYRTGDSAAVDDAVRTSDFAGQALAELRRSSDAKLIAGAGFWITVQGGMLYADGKIDWDYTTVSHELLQRALALDPTTVELYAVDQPLPKRGQRPTRVFGTSAAHLRSLRIKSVTPIYPPDAKAKGVEGKVTLNLLIGPDGKVAKAVITGGPAELAEGTLEAVKQWEYKPSSCFNWASAEVTFSLSGVEI